MDHSDAKLVALTLKQGSQFFGKLVKRHTDYLYGFGMRLSAGNDALAKDMSQLAFLKAFNYLGSFDANHSALGADPNARFRNWLTGIAVNCYKDIMNKESRYATLADDDLARIEQPQVRENNDEFSAMIQALGVEDRQIVTLRFVYEYSIDEIAGMLGLKSGTIKSKLSRAVAKLRNDLGSGPSGESTATQKSESYERV